MNVYVDVERICNKAIDQLLKKINPNLSLNENDRKAVIEGMMEQFSNSQDDLEYTIEKLLIQRFEEQSSDLLSSLSQFSQLMSLFGGKNND